MAASPRLVPVHPARRGARPIAAEDLWVTPRVGSPSPYPDGSALVVPVTQWDLERNEARTRFHRVPVAGGTPVPLTSPDQSAAEPRVSPDGRWLAFTRRDDDQRPQLMVMPLDGGEARRLTDLPLGCGDPRWLPDGSGLVVVAQLIKGHLTIEATATELERRAEDPVRAQVTEDRVYRFWDTWLTTGEVPHLFVVPLAGGEPRDLMPESEAWFDWMDPAGQYDLSPDGRDVAWAASVFDERRSLLLSRIFTAPVAGGPVRCLTPDHPADALRPRWSPDGRTLLYGMTHDIEFYADRVRLMRVDRASGTHTEWLGDWDHSPMHWEWTSDGRVVFEADHDGRLKAFVWDGTGEPRELTTTGSVSGTVPLAGGRVAFQHQSLASPAEVCVLPLAGGTPAPITSFTREATALHHTGEVLEMRYEGARGAQVQMFVILPPDHEPGRRHPLVHLVHGGPHGSFGDQWHARWNAQAFAAPGQVVALVNFQGSTGWGQDFAQRIQGEWAARPFEDLMRATDALVASGLVDESRMAVTGGSYGGYMASWVAGHTDRFRCIVNHAGVCDLTGQYASDVTQGRGRAAGGEVWDGLERQDAWSPIRFARDMRTPMLIVHGERDYRVPVGQGLLLYGVLKAKGVPARLVYFPDENHWVLKPRNSLLWYGEVLGWLDRWLRG